MNKLKEARLNAGLTQKGMADLLEIPKRTIENWEGDINQPPAWAEKLIIEKLQTLSHR